MGPLHGVPGSTWNISIIFPSIRYIRLTLIFKGLWFEPLLIKSLCCCDLCPPPRDTGHICFSHPLMKRFLRGLLHLYPQVHPLPPAWDLPLILRHFTRHPFEPLASCDLRLLTWKTAFLVAITSALRVSELVALCRTPPYLVFQPHSVRLRPDSTFLPKVVSQFHLNADIILPDFFPSPKTAQDRLLHTLDVKRALLYYLERTKSTAAMHRLFLTYALHRRGLQVSSQRFSRWITATISLCYQLEGLPVPTRLTAHSTRAMASSHTFLDNVSLEDIIKHYAIDVRAQQSAPVSRSVLHAAAPTMFSAGTSSSVM